MRFLVVFLFALTSIWSPQAGAEPVSLQGKWHQVASNAGKCSDCSILVEWTGSNFTVTANNGWSAIVQPDPGGKAAALGKGNWKPSFGGAYGGRPFLLHLGIVNGKLLMIMTVPKPDSSVSHINAVFEKTAHAGDAV